MLLTFGQFFDLYWQTKDSYLRSRLFNVRLSSASLVSTVRRSLQFLDLHLLPGGCEACGSSMLGEMLAENGGRVLVFAEGGNIAKTLELGFL